MTKNQTSCCKAILLYNIFITHITEHKIFTVQHTYKNISLLLNKIIRKYDKTQESTYCVKNRILTQTKQNMLIETRYINFSHIKNNHFINK